MAMTKKHYIAVAKAFKHRVMYLSGNNGVSSQTINAKKLELEIIAHELAAIFKADNGAFRPETFYSACGFNEIEPAKQSPRELAEQITR